MRRPPGRHTAIVRRNQNRLAGWTSPRFPCSCSSSGSCTQCYRGNAACTVSRSAAKDGYGHVPLTQAPPPKVRGSAGSQPAQQPVPAAGVPCWQRQLRAIRDSLGCRDEPVGTAGSARLSNDSERSAADSDDFAPLVRDPRRHRHPEGNQGKKSTRTTIRRISLPGIRSRGSALRPMRLVH